MEPPDLGDALREAVELAQAEFERACVPGASHEQKQQAAIKLESAVDRLNDYILRFNLPEDLE